MNLNELIGQRIKYIRTQRGISQEDLAASAGIATTYVGQIERGMRNPTISVLENIADVLDVSIEEIVHSTNCDKLVTIAPTSELSDILIILEQFSPRDLHNTKIIIEKIADITNNKL